MDYLCILRIIICNREEIVGLLIVKMKTVRTAVLTMKINRMQCLFAKTQLPDLSVNKLYLNCRPPVTLTPILHIFSTRRLLSLISIIDRTRVPKSSAIHDRWKRF